MPNIPSATARQKRETHVSTSSDFSHGKLIRKVLPGSIGTCTNSPTPCAETSRVSEVKQRETAVPCSSATVTLAWTSMRVATRFSWPPEAPASRSAWNTAANCRDVSLYMHDPFEPGLTDVNHQCTAAARDGAQR